jgi:uncharacterized tellurite resistance protein B-like protein
MINTIKQFFEKNIQTAPKSSVEVSEHSLQLATAALMIEMMRADTEISDEEQRVITGTIKAKFVLSAEETETIIKLAEDEISKATGYFEFTSLINKGYSYDQKIKVVEHLWEVAFSDSVLDKYEEHMVRKIADLIHVSHKDYIEAKLRVRNK